MIGNVKEDWRVFNALNLLRKMLGATSKNRLRWGPSQGWHPNERDKPLMQWLQEHGLACPMQDRHGNIYFYPSLEAHELFGMIMPDREKNK